LRSLAIEEDVRIALEGVGLRTVGELAALPASALEDRFGPAGRAALQRALGVDLRRIDGRPPPALPEAALGLEHPVSTTAPLLFGLRGLLDRIASQLIDRGVSATRVDLRFTLDGAPEQTETLIPARPIHHPRALFELCRDRLEGLQVDAPVIELTVVICSAQPAVPEQTHLGANRWDARALEGALNRLHGRFGQSVVFTAQGRDDPRPEKAGVWVAVDEVPLDLRLPDGIQAAAAPAPVRRMFPQPVPLTARFDKQGKPIAIQRGATWRPVSAYGPERLSGGWWDAEPYAREDWRLICFDEEGGVLWASRTPDGQWWLQGHWD
jgi:protein ImuB